MVFKQLRTERFGLFLPEVCGVHLLFRIFYNIKGHVMEHHARRFCTELLPFLVSFIIVEIYILERGAQSVRCRV